NIAAVDVSYSTDGAGYTDIATLQGVAFGAGDTKTGNWTPPEVVDTSYFIKVTDSANPAIDDPSVGFVVKGKIAMTTVPGLPLKIGETKTIEWNIIHGNIGTVKIIGSRSGDFTGGADEFDITPGAVDADGVTNYPVDFGTFGYVAQGSYPWVITEKTPSIIGDQLEIRIIDGDTNYDVKTVDDDSKFTIIGDLTVTTPAADWKVDGITETIEWTAYGDLGNVHLQYFDGSTLLDITDPAVGTPSSAGPNSYPITDWLYNNDGNVPDAKSDACYLRVTDLDDAAVTKDSGVFNTYPLLTGVTVDSSAGDEAANPKIWRVALAGQVVKWTDTSTKVAKVDIHLSTTGAAGLPGAAIKTGVDSLVNGENTCNTILLPAATSLTSQAIIRVRDNDPAVPAAFLDKGKICEDSAEFKIRGRIVLTSPADGDANWYVGDPDKEVIWTAYGDDMTNVEILIDYNDGNGYQSVKGSVGAGTSPWVFTDTNNTPFAGVADKVTENARIMIRDTDVTRQADTEYETPDTGGGGVFSIGGKFANVTAVPAAGDPGVVSGKAGAKITWTKTGAAISEVLLEYTTDGTNWNPLDDGVGTAGLVNNNESYNWTPLGTDISDTCEVRISDPDNANAKAQTAAPFTIASHVIVDKPDGTVEWDSGTQYAIQWRKWGTFDYVKIYYSTTGAFGGEEVEIDPGVPVAGKDSSTDGTNGEYLWTIGSGVVLSPTAKIKVIDSGNETFAFATPSAEFTTRGSLEVLTPDGGTEYIAGESMTLEWKRYENIAAVDVSYSTDGAGYTDIATLQGVAFGAGDTKTGNWT
ncbi:MAG: hypothetical protein ACYTFG_18815, partial [Planctomycetota bacterium]